MPKEVDKYRDLIGDREVNKIYDEASSLEGKHIVHVNSAYAGGGVAEILDSLVFLMNDVGIRTGWRLLKASPDFYTITKKFHNALQGEEIELSERKKRIYYTINRRNSIFTHLQNHDCVIVHDPQPLPLIKFYRRNNGKNNIKNHWIWRCHIDLSKPDIDIWDYLKNFINLYDGTIVSLDSFKSKDIKIPQNVISPSINPFIVKNMEIKESLRERILHRHGIETNKPVISQISRFDKWKDPLGVLEAYKLIRKKINCKLVLVGNFAPDDPEGPQIYNEVVKKVENEKLDVKIIINSYDNDRLVNSLQTDSSVVIQKSIREGFALTVSEALWKGTPVVGGNCGGIPLQIINGKTGYLVNSVKECADRVVYLLKNKKIAERLGENGREHVKKNFLMSRHLMDYIQLLKKVFKK
jgi:trehalose synthase